jgi:hypothetical protein
MNEVHTVTVVPPAETSFSKRNVVKEIVIGMSDMEHLACTSEVLHGEYGRSNPPNLWPCSTDEGTAVRLIPSTISSVIFSTQELDDLEENLRRSKLFGGRLGE